MNTIITINFDTITDQTTWENKNRSYYSNSPFPTHTHTHSKKFIDIKKIPNDLIADWLQENGNHICYEESYETIEATHKIPHLTIYDTVEFVGISWEDLQNEIKRLGIINYQSYVVIDVDQKNKKLIFTKINKHDPTKNNFSLPFLNSVAFVNKLNNNDLFMFGETSTNQLLLSIKNKNYFYDITDYPYSLKIKR